MKPYITTMPCSASTNLRYAIESNDMKTVRKILDEGSVELDEVLVQECLSVDAPLTIAVCHQNLQIVQLLIDSGCNLEHANTSGDTVLLLAVRRRCKMPMIRLLVEAGANVNHVNKASENVLFIAIKTVQRDIVRYLINQGVFIDLKDSQGYTPLLLALHLLSESFWRTLHESNEEIHPCMAEICSEIIPHSHLINYSHNVLGTALRLAVSLEMTHTPNNLRLSKLLLQHGAQPDRLFFLRFGGLKTATSPRHSEFFTREFFELVVDSGAVLQREKTWLVPVLNEMPQELRPHQPLFQELLQRAMSAMPLQTLCIKIIRKQLDGNLWAKIDKLPLPNILKECLKLLNYRKSIDPPEKA